MIYDRFTKDLFPFLPLHDSAPSVTFRGDNRLSLCELQVWAITRELRWDWIAKIMVN